MSNAPAGFNQTVICWDAILPHIVMVPWKNGCISSLQYCWWLKSCTTWDVENPINNGINYLSNGAGFQPSTVVLMAYFQLQPLSSSKKDHFNLKVFHHIRRAHTTDGQFPEIVETELTEKHVGLRLVYGCCVSQNSHKNPTYPLKTHISFLKKKKLLVEMINSFCKSPFFSWHSLMFRGVNPVKDRWNSIIRTRSLLLHPGGLVASTAAAAEVLQLLPEMQWQQEHLGPTARYPPKNQQLAPARRAPRGNSFEPTIDF